MKHFLVSIALLIALAGTAFATDVTISATTVANSRGYSGNVRLRIYYTGCSGSNFLDSTGQVVMCGTVGSATGFYAEIPVTVVGSTLTIPSHILPSTDDSSTPTVTATAVFFVNNARRDFWYSNWIITRTLGPSVSFAQLWDYNKTAVPSPATSTTLTASGISQLIRDSSQAPIVETPGGLVNGANTTFTISQSIVLDSDELFLNGVRQERITAACTPGTETYSISGQTITHCLPPQTGDVLIVTYRIAAALIGTVDPAVRIRETSGPTTLLIQGIADGQCLRRTGLTVDGVACGGGGGGGGLTDPGSNGIVKRTALNTTTAATPGTDYLLPTGSGAALTALNATQLTTGTIPDARFPAVLPAVSGVNLTNLNATNLASGTVADARLSANIPRLDAVNAFTANNTFSASVGVGTISPDRPLEVLSAAQSQLRLTHTDSSAYTDFTVGAGGTLTVSPTGNYIFDTSGNQIDPATNFDQSLGQLSKKYLSLHAAELFVETLVAQDTIATIGGRILVGPTTMLVADLSSIQVSIDVKHNNLANGDRVYLEAGGNVEFLAITNNGQVIANGFRYSVTRNLDGTGANAWIAGSAVFNTGTTGDGFIDLYSVRGVKAGTELGPTIVGNVRNSATFNDWSPRWAIGNLNGLYGYGSDTYGVALGVPTAAWVKVDPTNGVRIGHNLTTHAQIDAAGNASFTGTVTAAAGAIGGWSIGADYIRDAANSSGMASTVTGGDDVRFWAGDTFANRATSDFRVTEAGALVATSATITGAITATSGSFTGTLTSTAGSIGGWTLGATALTSGSGATTVGLDSGGSNPALYAGSATPGSAPFRVTNAGALTSSNAAITGSFSGASGVVTIDSFGMSITNGAAAVNQIKFKDGSDNVASLYGADAGISVEAVLKSRLKAGATGDYAETRITAHDDSDVIRAGVYAVGYGSAHALSQVGNVVLQTSNGGSVMVGESFSGASTPTTSVLMELGSTTGALLITRLTTAQRDALTSANGMIIYNSTTGKFQGRAAGAWVDLH